MNDPEYSKKGYFNAAFEKNSYLNGLFLVLQLPVSIVFFFLVFFCFLLGALLIIIWIGVPIINTSFIMAWSFADYERYLANKIYAEHIPAISKPQINVYSQVKVFFSFIRNHRTWKYLSFHCIKLLLSLVSFAIPLILAGLSFMLIYTPFNAMFGHIRIFSFYQTDSFIEAIFVFFIGIFIWIGIINLINLWTAFVLKVTKYFLGR